MLAQPLLDLAARALVRFANEPWRIRPEIQGNSPVGAAERPSTGPDHVAHRDQLIEQLWPVVSHPYGQHVTFEYRCRNGAALQLENNFGQPVQSARLDADAVPPRKESPERFNRDWLDFAPQCRQGLPPQ